MRIIRHPSGLDAAERGCVAVIGNFDGVHSGHRAVIGEGRRIADALGARLAVITFEPHPRRFFRPDEPEFQLTPLRSKVRLLRALGVDVLLLLHFDAQMASLTPEDFVRSILIDGVAARHVVVGYDFVFGKGRTGNTERLRALAAPAGIGVTEIAPVRMGEEAVYSSTAIRTALAEGDPSRAARLLGRPWEIEGRVLHGDKRGHKIGFPTANLSLAEYLTPALGVYAVWAGLEGSDGLTGWHAGCTNVGRRPTFDGRDITVETFIFDFSGDIYDRMLRIALVEWIRAERKFSGIEEIKAQIGRDADAARKILAAIPADDPRALPQSSGSTVVA